MTRRAGVTLVEMLLVLLLLGLVVSVAIPRADAIDGPRLDAASDEIRRASRFAQEAAMRTGAWYAVSIDATSQVVRVYQLNALYAEDTSVTVMHPVDKAAYRVAFGAGALNVVIVSAVFQYKNNGNTIYNFVAFGPDSVPAWGQDKNAKPNSLKNDGVVTLRHGKKVRTVTIDSATGRVTF